MLCTLRLRALIHLQFTPHILKHAQCMRGVFLEFLYRVSAFNYKAVRLLAVPLSVSLVVAVA
jgi:hypothetical protein